MTPTEQMAEAYWNAFRRGFGKVGGPIADYPTWQQGGDPVTKDVQSETLRCMRHAAEVLRPLWGRPFDEIFQDPPAERSARRNGNDDAMARKVR